jgi:hypothetical protein
MEKNIRTGLAFGFVMATLYAMYALLVFGLRGPDPFASKGTTVGSVILMYYTAGITGGTVVGVLLPVTQTLVGVVTAGMIAGLIVVFCGCITLYGVFWEWDANVWKTVGMLGPIFGATGAIILRKVLLA